MQILNIEAFLIAITILTLTPGLDTALVIRNTTRAGSQHGFLTSFGICCGLFVHATFSAIGISAILLQSAEWFMALKMVGAAYLIWLGISSIRAVFGSHGNTMTDAEKTDDVSSLIALREGFLSNVLNPKTAVFYLAFLPQFIDPQGSALAQSMLMATIHFVIAMVWQGGLVVMVNKAKQLLKSESFLKIIEGATGLVLIGLGVKLLVDER
ncbi:putative Lysine/threonine efflux family protein [Vibrio nigripulchritudo SFn27]|uniref:Putative Lysine/threonine efflux family protein n=1 Tax=Vibrio nigripulchritudo TaxID=28173 RepID=U4KFM3_9VIBR|nr:LysE family translocator [Vibrio nigripulchritudo]CCN81406.1 putative Lysine/threonine efflux family protein [Vibrio nigripulchritudo BLFn1]CCN88922.1 putative Lysine/threonine efflux family protein [Vibrio nigripulchritudo SFn27]CCN96724.1 putative Lysine/threonine efflux family protein [Vibrio nigripulchritudo ENn2]CCO39134.1 putative Lysine/threonine efflux family protein [Vibrio nigripulchritudo SFn135]CCO54641.1 putative Lysine/threonine efflux family protein [Vibrio nigripulchritudo W